MSHSVKVKVIYLFLLTRGVLPQFPEPEAHDLACVAGGFVHAGSKSLL